jgi:ketosteroid isomerase-like protein
MAGDTAQVEALTALYADPTNVSHPLLHGYPTLVSRADMRRHFEETPRRAPGLRFQAQEIRIHHTNDPEVIVAEFTYRGAGPAGPLTAHCIFVWRVRNGLIVEARDYIDYAAFGRAARRAETP